MKSELNGVLNMSTLDGWSVEGIVDKVNGFLFCGISHGRSDFLDAQDLYRALARAIQIYDTRSDDGIPHLWIRMMKTTILSSRLQFGMDRMLAHYTRSLFLPAARDGGVSERARHL